MQKININSTKKEKIELLDCQVELILNSLQLYMHINNFLSYPSKKSKNLTDNLFQSFISDTYEQILFQSKNADISAISDTQKFIKKFSKKA